MKNWIKPEDARGEAGFTMVEVALSLGILAFALVAIVGVLPSGMKVQRENRESTIINQDASYLLEAIRNGSKGADLLTNFVESITVTRGRQISVYTNNWLNPRGLIPLTNSQEIVSLLSTPKVERLPNGLVQTNLVQMQMRAITGNAMEKSTNDLGFAFRYQVTSEVVPFSTGYLTNAGVIPSQLFPALSSQQMEYVNLARNLYSIRLIVRWPVFQKGTGWGVGRYRRTLRTLASSELRPLYTNAAPYYSLYLFQPSTYISAY